MTIDSPKRCPANTAISRIGRLAKRWPIFFLENDWIWAKKCILLESNYTLGIDSVRSLEGPISTSLLPRFTSYERRQWLFKNWKFQKQGKRQAAKHNVSTHYRILTGMAFRATFDLWWNCVRKIFCQITGLDEYQWSFRGGTQGALPRGAPPPGTNLHPNVFAFSVPFAIKFEIIISASFQTKWCPPLTDCGWELSDFQ